jgi:glucose/arabinose dehydrogenase
MGMTTAYRLGALAATALLAACSSAEPTSPSPPAFTPPSPGTSASAQDAGMTTVATGLTTPWGLAFLPDGSALVSERDTGRVKQIKPGGKPETVYTVPGVAAQGEGGLLGLAVADDYATTKHVYAYFTAAADNRIVRFTIGDSGNDTPEVIFDGIDKAGNHNGGRIAFGPDRMLYVGTGDADVREASQDPSDSNGKILRLTKDGRPAPGNPTEGSPVWTLGHRNVQGLAWSDDGTMYGIEFGQNTYDEVNRIEKGKNYGWPEVEGTGDGTKYENPLVTWSTDEASPSGAAVSGDTLHVAALRGERLWSVPLGGGEPTAELEGDYGRLRTVAVAPDGALWITTSNTDGRGDVRDGDDKILRLPAR